MSLPPVILFYSKIVNRRQRIHEKSEKRREMLEESRKLQQFEKEADETKAWINEKLKIATDESYKVISRSWQNQVELSVIFRFCLKIIFTSTNNPEICLFYLIFPTSAFQQDPTNLQRKVQKHEAFNAELEANQSRIDSIDDKGKQLITNEHYASDIIQKRLDELDELWKHLLDKTQEKGKGVWL